MKLTIIGASGHGSVVSEIARVNGYDEIVFLDDNPEIRECNGYPVVGRTSDPIEGDLFVAIGDPKIREHFMEGRKTVTLIHPSAVVASTAKIGEGTVLMACAVVSAGATVGRGCIVNTSSTVAHDCVLEDFVHVSAGVVVSGTTRVGRRTWVAPNSSLSNNISVCGDCFIGLGTVVIHDITEPGTYVGVPARKIH